MALPKSPVFRRPTIPWYHSKTAYLVVMAFMFLVLLFASVGISMARANAEYRGYVWLPLLLLVLSASVLAATTWRLIKRLLSRDSRETSRW